MRRDDQFLSVERRHAEPQRPARRGHPRRGHGPAQHRAPGPAGLRPLDRDGARDLEPDRQLPERRPGHLPGRRELDQERHGVGQRARVRGVQGAQQHPVAASARRPSTPRSRARSTCASRATARRCGRSARPTARPGPTPATPPTSTGSPTRRSACTRRRPPPRGTQANTARFDYFTLDAPQEPSDEFDGTSLNLCRWSQIVRHEPGGYTVGDGKLTLPAAHGDFFANGANNNPNILLQPAPSGPWTMTTRLTFNPNENYEQAGLLVYGDDANYVKADYVYANGRGLEFLREANNVAAGFGGFVNINTRPTTVDMRITSDGTTLRAYYRFEGEPWTPYGEPAALASVPNPKVGIYANDSNATVTTRDDAVFDFFRITPGLPDTTAPTTTHTLAPAGERRRLEHGQRDADAGHGGRGDHPVQARQRGVPGLHGPGHAERRGHARWSPTARPTPTATSRPTRRSRSRSTRRPRPRRRRRPAAPSRGRRR